MFLSLWGDSVKSDPDLFQWPFLKRKVAASDCQDTFSVGLKPKITRTPGFLFRFFLRECGEEVVKLDRCLILPFIFSVTTFFLL